MKRWAGFALFFAMAILFLIANRGAYKGYFEDDELDNLGWAPVVSTSEFGRALISPRFLSYNFRPAGHFYFHVMGRHFDLDFPKYLIPIHALHFLNVWLVWLIARRLGASVFAASAGGLFFAFHMAAFNVYWHPMYVFDLLCGSFCLLSLLFYMQGRWVFSFVAFWLAYKSKELAVMLPLALAAYEFWFGKRRSKPLVPFFLVSLSFGLQGIFLNPNQNNDYTFRFTPGALWRTSAFYGSRILLFPYAGFAVVLAGLWLGDRRVRFGLITMLLFFAPLAFLPGRIFSAYCYLPLAGLAIAFSGAFSGMATPDRRIPVTVFLVLWMGWNYIHLRFNRRQALAIADENRAYVTALADFARRSPDTRSFVYDGTPSVFRFWGISGALRYFYKGQEVELKSVQDPGVQQALAAPSVAILSWDPGMRKLTVAARHAGTSDQSYITMDHRTPLWQLTEGWYPLEGRYRWIAPRATARLWRPEGAKQFELTVNAGPGHIRDVGRVEVSVVIDGERLGSHAFTRSGWQTARWPVGAAKAGTSRIEFEVIPPYQAADDRRALGLAVVAFGFLPEGS